MAEVGEHYRKSNDATVYRVVGATDEVTLLCVTDADGRRAYTGAIHRVSPSALGEEYEPATNPDAGFHAVSIVRNAVQGLYWNVRKFL